MNANHVKRNLPYIIMAIPAVSIFSVFFIIPLIFTTKYSFYNWTNFSPDIVFSGLKNYKQLLADGIILKGFFVRREADGTEIKISVFIDK